VYPVLSSAGYFRRRARRTLSVLTYHGVLPEGYASTDAQLDGNLVSTEAFRRQLRWLKSRYRVISPEEFRASLESGEETLPGSVLLSCDDGLRNTLTDMLPVLREEGLSCLFFVTGLSAEDTPHTLWYEDLYRLLMAAEPGPISFPRLEMKAELTSPPQRRQLWWKLVLTLSKWSGAERNDFIHDATRFALSEGWSGLMPTDDPRQRRFCLLTRSELAQLAASGMFVGAHSMSHPVLAQQSDQDAMDEIQRSRCVLERVLGTKVWAFAYPFGDPASVGPRHSAMAEKAGFECAFRNFGGVIDRDVQQFVIPRVHVTAEMSGAELEAHLSGFHNRLRGRLMADQQCAS
jgi:peptidoglycan/xylan/chitin deacetylase (PgdA/CDA1 family)